MRAYAVVDEHIRFYRILREDNGKTGIATSDGAPALYSTSYHNYVVMSTRFCEVDVIEEIHSNVVIFLIDGSEKNQIINT